MPILQLNCYIKCAISHYYYLWLLTYYFSIQFSNVRSASLCVGGWCVVLFLLQAMSISQTET